MCSFTTTDTITVKTKVTIIIVVIVIKAKMLIWVTTRERMNCNRIHTCRLSYRRCRPLLLPTTLNVVFTQRRPFVNVIVCVGHWWRYSPMPSQMYAKWSLSMADYHNDTPPAEIKFSHRFHECTIMWQIDFMSGVNSSASPSYSGSCQRWLRNIECKVMAVVCGVSFSHLHFRVVGRVSCMTLSTPLGPVPVPVHVHHHRLIRPTLLVRGRRSKRLRWLDQFHYCKITKIALATVHS